MVIGFDIDQTITEHPPFFAFLADALIKAGHTVVIITFRDDREIAAADLARWGIRYSHLITSTLDDCLNHGVNGWKAHVCRQLGVDIFFEDDADVIAEIGPDTVCLMPVPRSGGGMKADQVGEARACG